MPKFKYKVREASGKEVIGEADATDRFALAAEMRAAGKTIISVEIATGASMPFMDRLNSYFSGKVKIEDLIVFSHNLSAMMSAGLSLSRALDILERQTQNKKFQATLKVLVEEISHGNTLSAGMAKFPTIFSTVFVAMVRAGEESGSLAAALLTLGDQLEKSYNLRKKIKSALIYPSVVITALIIIAVLMFIFVVPTLAGTFREMNIELPASTAFIIGISDFLKNNLLLGIGMVIATGVSFSMLLRTKQGNRLFETVLFRIPLVGDIVRESNSARTTRTLSSLLTSGVEMVEAINITKGVLENTYYKEIMDIAAERVQKGIPLSSIFMERGNVYPLLVGEMMEVGEETGKLSDMLLNVAKFYEDDVDSITKNMSTIIEPVLMVFIGGSVGFFAISMISPMYSVMSGI